MGTPVTPKVKNSMPGDEWSHTSPPASPRKVMGWVHKVLTMCRLLS